MLTQSTLQEAELKRKARRQEEMQDEYAKIKNRLKNMDIELHTEVNSASHKLASRLSLMEFVNKMQRPDWGVIHKHCAIG